MRASSSPCIVRMLTLRLLFCKLPKVNSWSQPSGKWNLSTPFLLRVFRNEVPAAQAQSSVEDFEKDLRNGIFQLRPLSDQAFDRTCELSRQTTPMFGTRTSDLLHVAAALELGVDCLYTFDKQQRKLAQAVRLKLN